MRRIRLTLSMLAAVGLMGALAAEARDRRGAVAFAGPLETAAETSAAKGCYWHRQKQYCGRYCYIEGNGIRYCREREADAFPQMPDANVFFGAPYSAPSVK